MAEKNNNESAKRNSTLDIAKGLGMTFVVMFHAQLFPEIFTQFHMPLFAFLSGFVYREKYHASKSQLFGYIKKKIVGCYVPFVTYNIVFLLMHNLLYKMKIYGAFSNGKLYTARDFLKQTVAIVTMGGGESLPGPMWYLIAMLEFTIIYALIRFFVTKFVKNKKTQNITITAACIVLLFIGFSPIDLPRKLNEAFVLLFYYHLGYMTYSFFPDVMDAKFGVKTSLICIVSFSVLLIGMSVGGGKLDCVFMDHCSSSSCGNNYNAGNI